MILSMSAGYSTFFRVLMIAALDLLIPLTMSSVLDWTPHLVNSTIARSNDPWQYRASALVDRAFVHLGFIFRAESASCIALSIWLSLEESAIYKTNFNFRVPDVAAAPEDPASHVLVIGH